MRDVSAITGIDPALISKMEGGGRLPTEKQMGVLAELYQLNTRKLKTYWLAEKIFQRLEEEGNALEVLTIVRNRIEKAQKDQTVRIPGLTPEIKEKLAKVDFIKQLLQKRPPLEKEVADKRDIEFITEFVHESNRLAASPLSPQETKTILNKGGVAAGKSLSDHLAVVNHYDAVLYLQRLIVEEKSINPASLLELHAILFRGIDRNEAGKYRRETISHKDRLYQPPPPQQIEDLIEGYFNYYHQQRSKLHPILLAAIMHQRLIGIHPFRKGNGRIARLIMNFILLRRGYTIISIKGDSFSKQVYERALEKMHVSSEEDSFFHLIADAAADSLRNYLDWRVALY